MSLVVSLSSAKIKEIRKLHQKKFRDLTCLYLAEGFKFLEEFTDSGFNPVEVFVLKGIDTSKIKVPFSVINENDMKKISTTDSVCEVLTVARKRNFDHSGFSLMKKVLLTDSISDPGNLGTIIRSAAAFNFDGIVLFGNCTDLYSSKVIRSCAGNFFKIPVISLKSVEEVQSLFASHVKISTDLKKKCSFSFNNVKNNEKYLIMFGSEASGLSFELSDIADKNLKLDMTGNVESLNLSVAASIVLYEFRSL